MFTHVDIVKQVPNIKSSDGPKGRFYTTPNGNKYPSITTLLGAGDKTWLQEWRQSMGIEKADKEMKRAADRGTAVHLMIEKFLNNEEEPTAGQKIELVGEFNAIKVRLRKINNIYIQEAPLYSDTLKVAGRVDCIAEYDGKLAIIDFKTSNNNKDSKMVEDYYLQTTAYALMFEEMYGIKIDQIVILMSVERGAVPLMFKQNVDDWIEPLVKRINTYYKSLEKK